jgi:hypothetical protein
MKINSKSVCCQHSLGVIDFQSSPLKDNFTVSRISRSVRRGKNLCEWWAATEAAFMADHPKVRKPVVDLVQSMYDTENREKDIEYVLKIGDCLR